MGKNLHFDKAAEKEATDIGARFMHSSDVVDDMSRAYGRDLSSVRIHTDESAARGAAERGVDAFSTGKDVFFARGAFDQGDPASRGLLAHELSHSMQQGVGGGAPALTQSAPMGAEQGGLREWFKGLFGKSGNAEDSAPEQEPAAPAQEVAETDAQPELAQNNHPQKELDDAAEVLRSSKKWGWSQNTDKFERVSSAIDASIGQLSTPLSGNMDQDQEPLNSIIAAFTELIQACDDYLSRSPRTGRGKHRQAIVLQVRELAVKDRGGFVRYKMTPDEGEHFTSAMDVLTRSRQRTLQLVDKNEEDLEHVGGAASYIAKIEPGMLTDADASGFFKADEVYTKHNDSDHKSKYLAALESARQKMTMSEEQYNALQAVILEKGTLLGAKNDLPGYFSDPTLHDAVTMIVSLVSSEQAVEGNLRNPLQEGESLNLSKRNVATSRLAELLGLGDLIAKSETAVLKDNDGTERSGNLMQKARGQEVTSFVVDQFRDQYAAERVKYGYSGAVKMTGNLDDKVTPEFLKSLMSLQVLDNLAAQEDRHSANYFAEIKDGKLGKVQGIDNDFSFTSNTLDADRIGTHGKNILDQEGNLTIPYMDKDLADRITALDESVLRDVMADILEPWAIDALCIRFSKIKTAIQKDQENNPNSGRYLAHDEDWASQEVFDTLRNGAEGMNATNYVSNLLLPADMSQLGAPGSQDFRGQLENDLLMRLATEVLTETQSMSNAEEVKAHLRPYGVQENVLSYLEATGQLFDGPALLKRLPNTELYSRIAEFYHAKWKNALSPKKKKK